MRSPRFRLRALMICIAFLALILTVIVQAILLQRAAAREQLLRAEAQRHRAEAQRRQDLAEAINQRFRAAIDQELRGPQ